MKSISLKEVRNKYGTEKKSTDGGGTAGASALESVSIASVRGEKQGSVSLTGLREWDAEFKDLLPEWRKAKAEEEKAEAEKKSMTEYYLDTLNNQTYMPHNTHMDELNAHMVEEGLHPIYTDSAAVKPFLGEMTPYAKGKWTVDETTGKLTPPEMTSPTWYHETAKKKEAEREAAYQAQQERINAFRAERDAQDGNEWEDNYRLLLDLQAGKISQEEYDAAIGGTVQSRNDEREATMQRSLDYKRYQVAEARTLGEFWRKAEEYAPVAALPEEAQKALGDLYLAGLDDDANLWERVGEAATGNITLGDDGESRKIDALSRLESMGYSYKEIQDFLLRYSNYHNDLLLAQERDRWEKDAREHPVLSTIAAVGAGFVSGLPGMVSALITHPGERNSPMGGMFSNYSGTVQETISGDIHDAVQKSTGSKFAADLASWGYSAVMSSAQSAAAMSLPVVGEVLLSANAAYEKYNDLLDKGMPQGKALVGGLVAGAFEALFEHLSLENLRSIKELGKKGFVSWVKSGVIEGSEELFTSVANGIYDWMVNGKLSEMTRFIDSYYMQNRGSTEEEAKKAFVKHFGDQLVTDTVVGMFSGLLGGGSQIALNGIGARVDSAFRNIDVGQGVRSAAEVQGISEQDVVRPVTDLLGEDSKARRQIVSRLSNEAPQGSRSSEVAADAAMEEKNTAGGGAKFSRVLDANGKEYVQIDRDVIAENSGKSHAQILATVIHSDFHNIITANGQNIRANQTTSREWLKSKEARWLEENAPDMLDDKVRAIANADELLASAREWINEEKKHKNFESYARGSVRYSFDGRDYTADIIVGIDSKGEATLYDLVNIYATTIQKNSRSLATIDPQKSEVSPVHETPVASNIAKSTGAVNTQNGEKRSLFRRVTDYVKQSASDYRKGAAVNRAVSELKESDRVTIEERLKAQGYGERNAKSTSYQILQLLSGEMESADAEHLLEKRGVEAVIGDYLTSQSTSDTEEYKRTRAAAELLKSLDIARGEGSAEDKLRRIRWVSETYDLKPEEAIQYFADEATKDVTAEAALLTRDGKDLSGVMKRAYKAQITVDGKALDVEIKGVAGVEDGDLLLKTEKDGETVTLSEVDFDAFEGGDVSQAIFEDIRRAMTGTEFKTKMSADAANVLLGIIETQPLSVGRLIEDFYRYYAAGKAGRSFEGVEKTYDAVDLANRSSEAVREAAFEAGQREYEAKPGLTRIGGTQKVTETQVDEMLVIDSWAKSIGKSFFVVDGLFSDYVSERGFKHRLALTNGLRNDNCILLSLKTGDLFGVEGQHWTRNLLLVTAVHETVHEIKARDANAYNLLKDMALRALGAREGKDGMNRIFNRFYETYRDEIDPGATQKEVFEFLAEEVTAQYFGVAITRGSIDEFVKADGEETVRTEKIGFLEKLKEIFKRIAAALQKKLEELAKKDLVAASVMQADVKELQRAVETFDAVLESVKDLSAARTGSAAASAVRAEGADQNKNTAEGAVKHSYAGRASELADHSLLETAARMEEEGRSSEEIRKETGWFRGMDGQWRYEIDDSKMKIDLTGAYMFNPDVRRLKALQLRLLTAEDFSEAEAEELRGLEKALEGVRKKPKYLGEIMQHDELFAAYPELRDVPIFFEKMDERVHGAWDSDTGTLVLNEKYLKNDSGLKEVLLHEMQHMIQEIEGFAEGASPDYWSEKKYSLTKAESKKEADAKARIKDAETKITETFGEKAREDLGRYWRDSLFKKNGGITSEEADWMQRFEERDLGEDWNALFSEWQAAWQALDDVRDEIAQRRKEASYLTYWRTAGEIEARDTEARADLTAEERKENRPDVDRTDVVFADDSGMSYEIREIIGESGKNYGFGVFLDSEALNGLNDEERKQAVVDHIKALGGKPFPAVSSDGSIVEIIIAPSDVKYRKENGKRVFVSKDMLNYLNDKTKQEALVLVEEVIETANYSGPEKARHSHDWLDDNGRKDWDLWTTYLLDSDGMIWEASLRITNTINDEKILFDIFPIIKKEASQTMATTSKNNDTTTTEESQEKKSLAGDAEALAYASEMREGNAINRARIDLLEDAAGDIHAYEDGEITLQQAQALARKYNLSGDETQRKEITRQLMEIRQGLIGSSSLDSALFALYRIAYREASAAGHWEEVDSGSKEGKAFVKGQKIFVDEQTLTNIAEKYGGRAALRRLTFGKFLLTTKKDVGTSGSLDAFYQEALANHLGLEATDDPDQQVENLLSFWGRTDRIWVSDDGAFGEGQTLEETATDYAVQMLRDLLYAGRKPTETEKARLARLDVLTEELKGQREKGIHDALTASDAEYRKKLAELQASDLDMLEVERQAAELDAARRMEALKTAYEARINALEQNMRDQVARQQLTRDIHRNMSSLGTLIVNGRDADHIPEELRSSILAFAKLFGTNDRNVFTKAMARDLETVYGYIGKEYTEDGEQNPLFAGYDEDIAESIRQLAAIPKAGNGQILTGLLGLEDLRTLATVSEHILAIVKRVNSAFIDGRRVRLDGLGDAIIHDAETKERSRLARTMSGRGPYDYLTGDMLTPIWFFKEKVGGTMGEIYEGFRNAQDEWFRKVSRGRDAVQAAKEEFHYKQWKDGKTHFYFTDAFGNVFDHDLTVEQMLQIYATYMRERQNGMESLHLTTGGIVLEEEVQKLGDRIKRLTEKKKGSNEEKTKALSEELERRAINQRFQLSYEQIREIADSLTQEQRDYADAVVKFMSGDVSNWGNDATMRRYGYAKFKEKYYFPFQSSENYLYSKLGTTNDARLKAAGFSKKLVHGAKTPLVISSFSDVAASHIQEMAMYSAFLNPLEDFNQVWSYENKETGKSVKSEIGAVYGSRAQDYVSRFITDVNGGMRSDRIDNIWNKGTSLFKKAAVMANTSVVIQQPTALMRAMALINPKYFVGGFRLADYRNMMEHSEVAGIKEMGGFDTGMGASATEWMLDEKSVKEKISDAAGKGAEIADAVTWTNLWNAVRRETKAKNKDRGEEWIGSEEYYEECRKRFRDIVDYTQVYDSTLSKSALMRSKSALTRMVTAFMAEPTLSFNLITQSGKGRTIHKGRALAAFVANVVVNAAFQSIVGAWRKPDEDETYVEKWLEKFASNLLGDAKVGFLDSSLSPLTMIPWVKDLLSIWEGYDVSRSDVSVFSDLISAVQSVAKEIEKNGRPGFQSVLDLAGVISAFTPIPIRRATQDVQGLIRQITAWKDGLVHNSLEGARDAFLAGIGLEKGKTEGAYQAVLFKDEEYIRRQLIPDKAKIAKYEAEGYSHEDAVKKAEDAAKTTWHTNVRAGLIEQDERVLQAAESKVGYRFDEFEALVEAIVSDGFERNDVLKSVEKLVEEIRKAGETPEYDEKEEKDEELYAQKDLIPAWDDRDLVNFSKAWDRLEEQGIETKKLVSYSKKFLTEALENGEIGVAERLKTLLIGKGAEEKTVNGYARDYAEIYFDESGMNRPKTLEILMKLAGMEREEAESKLDYWGYKIGNPDGTLTQDQYGKYLEEVKPSGINVNVYETYVNLRKTAKGTDLDGDGKTDSGSVKKVVLPLIDSLPISQAQKDALYRLNGWSENTINEAPWR